MNKNNLTVFCFHEVNNNPSQFCIDFNLNVIPDLFAKQIKWIQEKYLIISPKDLLNDNPFPENSALITFDDAFYGAFENGIDFLFKNNIPSIMFVNMSHIINKTPLISSKAIFFEKYCKNKSRLISNQFHLKLNPLLLKKVEADLIRNYDEEIKKYQGRIADLYTLNKFSENNLLFFGNHLFSHWNSKSLNSEEFKFNVNQNTLEIDKFKNNINFFAFPNGQPGLCFSNENINTLTKLGISKAFSSSGNINISNDFLIDRIDLSSFEYNKIKFYLRLFISKFDNRYTRKMLGIFRKI